MNNRKIAFVKYGGFSHVNEMVVEILTREFPNLEIETIDVFTDLVNTKDLATIFHTLNEYSKEIFDRTLHIGNRRLYTSYFFHKLRKALVKRLAGRNYLFTFQTQSLFDASIPGIPHFVYTDHTALANLTYRGFDRAKLPSSAWIECEREIYHNATLNFTMSENVADSIVKDYGVPAHKVANILCGPCLNVPQAEVFDDNRYHHQKILFVGIEWERKGGPILEEAFKMVLDKFPNATLDIVGCSPKVTTPNCNIVGKVPLPEVSEYYKKASVFCLPTRFDPNPNVCFEAMAHKLPVITTNGGSRPEFTIEGKSGYLVEVDNPHQLAEKAIELLASPQKCKSFGEYGHRMVWDKYTWEKTGARISQNIDRFLSCRPI
ncbi:glycosyltransferase family 4 protein [Chamaesiphon sp. OTE_8_metabat_110]|uniref:glycosyltransferase family 4 protein n=1 Tax=Chamaesiphon sp. OTE_8_metabat_110 TaxID=2964696 RepID=UPI00286CF47C|nr:glycosyltransferase family 4 protein [Chamaesiphon sp. OTE_8_metabat_110]